MLARAGRPGRPGLLPAVHVAIVSLSRQIGSEPMPIPPTPPESISRYAPLGDMALAFDGQNTAAQADLPPGLLLSGETGLDAFAVTFWMNTPSPDPDPATAAPGQQVVAEIYGKTHGVILARWTVAFEPARAAAPEPAAAAAPEKATAPNLVVTCNILQAVISIPLPSDHYTGRWVFLATSYTPPPPDASPGNNGFVILATSNGSPAIQHTGQQLQNPANPQAEERQLTLGNTASPAAGGLTPYEGSLTRVRLWQTALDAVHGIATIMYDYPIGPRAYRTGPLIGDWRICEGYGTTAFDYSGEATTVRTGYQPPPGNHMRLGTGQPGTEPTWVVADITTLVGKASNASMPFADTGRAAPPSPTAQPQEVQP